MAEGELKPTVETIAPITAPAVEEPKLKTHSSGGVFMRESFSEAPAEAKPTEATKPEAKTDPAPDANKGMIPASRLAEERAKLIGRARAGLDPETGRPIAKQAESEPTEKPKPAEPWRKDLESAPSKDGKMVDGKLVEWEDTGEYLTELARVTAKNVTVESSGRARVEQEMNDRQKDADAFVASEAAAFREWDTVKRPAFLKEAGIAEPEFEASRTRLGEMQNVPESTTQLFRYFTLHEAESGPRFLYELGRLPDARLIELAGMSTGRLHREFIKMDTRLMGGLGLDGKPRALTESAKGGNGSGKAPRVSMSPDPPTMLNGGSASLAKRLGDAGNTAEQNITLLREQRREQAKARK